MSDAEHLARIAAMMIEELLDYVVTHPDHLTDSYYSDFARAVRKRHEQLRGQGIPSFGF